jgi:CxxC-x17-CxxC domain-containing protein
MDFEDKSIACVDCGAEFMFSIRDQEFYAEKGFRNDPKRCPECRGARRHGKRDRTSVTCAECGKEAQVPFTPRLDKPVYCDECFAARRAGTGNESRNGPDTV